MHRLRRWLHDHSVEDVMKSRRQPAVYVINREFTVRQCIHAFLDNRVHNLLVKSRDGTWKWQSLRSVLIQFESIDEQCGQSLADLCTCGTTTGEETLWDLIIRWTRLSAEDKRYPLLIKGARETIEGVLTVTDVLHYISIYGIHLSALMDRPTSHLNFDSASPKLVLDTKSAEEGLCLLTASEEMGVLGLIDRKGVLVAQLTLVDFLVSIVEDNLYLKLRELAASIPLSCPPVICCDQYSFGSLLRKVHLNGAHHIWRVDMAARPIGVVQISRLLEFVAAAATGKQSDPVADRLIL